MPIIKTGDTFGDERAKQAQIIKKIKDDQRKRKAQIMRKIRPFQGELDAEGASVSLTHQPDDRVKMQLVRCSDALSARINQAVKHLL